LTISTQNNSNGKGKGKDKNALRKLKDVKYRPFYNFDNVTTIFMKLIQDKNQEKNENGLRVMFPFLKSDG